MFCRLRNAFDRVNWVKLLEVLKSIGVDWQDRRLIERLYTGQKARVRLKDGLSEPAVIGCGTRQGCLLSPILFSIYYEAMLRDALSGVNYKDCHLEYSSVWSRIGDFEAAEL